MSLRNETVLWQRLLQHGLVDGEKPELSGDTAPWYVRTMLGIAGWIGALFLLAAVFSGFALLFDSGLTAGVLGVLACLAAIAIYRSIPNNDFISQFGFAVSLAGQGLVVFSVFTGLDYFQNDSSFHDGLRTLALVLVVLETVLFLSIPNFLHRIWSGVLGTGALIYLMIQLGVYPFTSAILLATLAFIWLQEFAWAKHGKMIQPLAYSLVFVSFIHLITNKHLLGFSQFWQEVVGIHPLGGVLGYDLAGLLLGVVLFAVTVVLLRRTKVALTSSVGVATLVLVIIIAVVGVRAPGIPIALVLVLLGYAHGNRVLTGMGLLTLVVFISQFYYQLNLTLLHKSVVLFLSGVVVLIMRQLMHFFWPLLESNDA